jgi:protein-tyrosine-phosphatase
MAAPLLEKLLQAEWGEEPVRKSFRILSAGVSAFTGAPASKEAEEVLRGEELDLSRHRAQRLDKILLGQADLVLTMTSAHKDLLLKMYPEAKKKVYTLLEYGSGEKQGEIPDPFGQGIEVYQQCAATIKEALQAIIPKLKMYLDCKEENQEK